MGVLSAIGGFFSTIAAPIKAVADPISKGYKARQNRKARIAEAKTEAKVARIQADAARWKQSAQTEASWDQAAMENSKYSWKDEWLTILITLPYLGAFIPNVQDYILTGFQYLEQVPYWYMLCFIGIVSASFGLRWLFSRNPAHKIIKAQTSSNQTSFNQNRSVRKMNDSRRHTDKKPIPPEAFEDA